MVKTPRTRHSGTHRDPVTIDLDADAVSRVEETGQAETSENVAAEHDPAEPSAAAGGDPLTGDAAETAEPFPDNQPEVEAGPDVAASAEADAPTYDYGFEAEREQAAYHQPGEETEYAPAEPAFAQAEPKRSGLSAIAAGLIGGAVVLAGGGILQYSGLLGSSGPVAAPSLDGVNAEIAALRSEIATLRETPATPGDDGRIEGFGQSLEQVQAEIASLKEALAAGGGGDTAGLAAKVADIEASVAGLGQATAGASPADIEALNERIAGLDALAKAAGEAGSAVDGRLGAIEQSLAALTAKVDAQTAQPKIALAIAASALKSAIERGSPFQSEIETFAAIVPDAPELPALRAHAETGVPSEAEIAAEADAAATAIIAAATPVSQNAGFLERLMDSAGSMVSVRPIGAVEGEGVPETVARMEVAIDGGDLPAALAEFESLPETAKAAAAPFGDKMRARVDAEKLIDQAIAAAMQAA